MTQKVQRTDLGWRGNKAFFKVAFNEPGGLGTADPVITITDSKTFTWTAAASTDSGKDISRFFRDFVIQKNVGTNMADVTIQINAGGGWITCPNGLITAQSNNNAVLQAGAADLAFVKLPPGCGLRLSITNIPANAVGEIFVQMSNSSEKADIARS